MEELGKQATENKQHFRTCHDRSSNHTLSAAAPELVPKHLRTVLTQFHIFPQSIPREHHHITSSTNIPSVCPSSSIPSTIDQHQGIIGASWRHVYTRACASGAAAAAHAVRDSPSTVVALHESNQAQALPSVQELRLSLQLQMQHQSRKQGIMYSVCMYSVCTTRQAPSGYDEA